MPNTFTPNGDGQNDVFRPIMERTPLNYTMRIFNRWGKEIFTSIDPLIGWDGTSNSKPQIRDTYIWVIEVEWDTATGTQKEVKRGNFTLLR